MNTYIFLSLFIGAVLFVISICYLDKRQIAFVGLLISSIMLGLSIAAMKKNIDRDFMTECVDAGGIVVKIHFEKLSCGYLEKR
ncbi:hypothetical protein VmeM32_00047 [Vibrio phage vB_VmeM-32]|nr:hypothetical protein VmeM32_00047 [Vibrio phage vB_VmeM-32]